MNIKISPKIVACVAGLLIAIGAVYYMSMVKISDVEKYAENNDYVKVKEIYTKKSINSWDEPGVKGTAAKYLISAADSNPDIKKYLLEEGVNYNTTEKGSLEKYSKEKDRFEEICGRDATIFFLQNIPDVNPYNPTESEFRLVNKYALLAARNVPPAESKKTGALVLHYKDRLKESLEVRDNYSKRRDKLNEEIKRLEGERLKYRMGVIGSTQNANERIYYRDPGAYQAVQNARFNIAVLYDVEMALQSKNEEKQRLSQEENIKQSEIFRGAVMQALKIKEEVLNYYGVKYSAPSGYNEQAGINNINQNQQNTGINNSNTTDLQKVYMGTNGTFTDIPALAVLSKYQGKWKSPEGRVSFEVVGDTVKDYGKDKFIKVTLSGKGTISRGEGILNFVNPPSGYSRGLDNIFRLYWNNGTLEADYYDGRGPHTTVRNRLVKIQ